MSLSDYGATTLLILFGAPVIALSVGFASGLLARQAANRSVLIATISLVTIFAAIFTWFGIYTAKCPDCTYGTQNDRRTVFFFALFGYGIVLVASVAALWIGSMLGYVLRERQHIAR